MTWQSVKIHLLILGLYLGLTLLLTYPLVLHFSTAFPGNIYDLYKHVWNLWWMKKALLELHTSPLFSDYIFYPLGTTLVFDTADLFSALLSIPLQLIFDLVTTHNILILFSFVFSAYGAYLLIRYLTANSYAAFIGGLIFAFCPYKFAHLRGHLNLIATEGIPFYVLYLFKTVQEPPKGRNVFLAGLFFLITALQSGYYAVYLGIFTGIYLIFLFFQNRTIVRSLDLWKNLGIIGLIIFIGLSPIFYTAFKVVQEDQVTLTRESGNAINLSADLMSFFYPSTLHSLWRGSERYVAFITESFRGGTLEADAFIGYTVLVLALYALFTQYRQNPLIKFWVLVALINGILSLGPFLQIHGHLFQKVFGYSLLYLPYTLVQYLPILREARAPSRFVIMVMLAMAVLAGYAWVHIFSKLQTRRAMLLLTMALVLLIGFEYIPLPFPLATARVPQVYYELSQDSREFTIMEIPFSWSDGHTHWGSPRKDFQYFQTVHGKRILNGHASRISSNIFDFYEHLPVISTIFKLQIGEENGVSEADLFQDRARARRVMDALHVKYIFLHRPLRASEVINDYLIGILEFKKIEVKDNIIIYTL